MLNLNNQKAIDNLHQNFIKPNVPKIQIGDTVKLGVKIIEGNKERVQFYEGTVIAKKNSSINTTITVRKVLQGIGRSNNLSDILISSDDNFKDNLKGLLNE